jgi:hypothetical protein
MKIFGVTLEDVLDASDKPKRLVTISEMGGHAGQSA